jgi:hypothetical protein
MKQQHSRHEQHRCSACASLFALLKLLVLQGSGTQISKEFDTGVVLTQLALPSQSKLMFAATETGAIRTYKWPLSGEYSEYKAHASAVTKLKISSDDSVSTQLGNGIRRKLHDRVLSTACLSQLLVNAGQDRIQCQSGHC